MSGDSRNLKAFEERAWRQFNGKLDSEPFPTELSHLLTVAWSRLSPNQHQLVASLADEFLAQQYDYQTAKDHIVAAQEYKGSIIDDDGYGNEKIRPDFDEYAACKANMLNVLQTLYVATKNLQQGRRLLHLPNDDCGASTLDTFLQHYEELIPTCQSELENLPAERIAATKRLSERQRIAEGGLGLLWEGRWPLGEGSFGRAILFVKQDSSGMIADHVVIKESSYEGYPHLWDLKELWTGWKGPDDLSSIPNEIQAMYNLSGKRGSENIVKIRNWRIRRDDWYHRIYMEFCPRGDLFDFCCGRNDDVYEAGADKRRAFSNSDMRSSVQLVPEAFLWSVFYSLTIAGLLMERGDLYDDGVGKDTWEVIVHRDMKLSNVFASWPSSERFKAYPALKLADFGLALLMPPNNDKVAENYNLHVGTPGNRAPEHVRLLPAGDGTTKMMSSKTNVFNVGLIMYSLIVCWEGLDEPYVSWNVMTEVPELDLTARLHYSDPLLSLIHRCLRVNDRERPTFDELMNEIKEYTGDGEFDLASGLRDAPVGDPRWNGHELDMVESKWKRDMMLHLIPRPGGGLYADPPPEGLLLSQDDFGGAPGAEVLQGFMPTVAAGGSGGSGSAGAGAGATPASS